MYNFLQKLRKLMVIILYDLFKLCKIDNQKIVLYSPSNTFLKGNLFYIKEACRDKKVYTFYKNKNIIKFLYMCATAKLIITDDFAPTLYPLKIRKKTKFIQVWHASGAFKCVGKARGDISKKTISHKNYTDVLVSSTGIIDDYARAFAISKDKIKAIGTIKTDFFFNEEKLKHYHKIFLDKYKVGNKKVLLYAPTFRGAGIKSAYYKDMLDLDVLKKKLGDEYIILFKMHPFIKQENKERNGIYYLDNDMEIDYILPFISLLITDYSSIIFDGILLSKPTIFYIPDLEEYQNKRGFFYQFDDYAYGNVTTNIDELIGAIKKPVINKEKMLKLKEKHLNMCDGKVLQRFIDDYLK